MNVVIENPQTGERRTIRGNSGGFRKPWRIVEIVHDGTDAKVSVSHRAERDAKLAVWATELGLPVAQFLDAARWLLDKDCPYCQLGTQVLRRINELGKERATEALAGILDAKQRGDASALQRIRRSLKVSPYGSN